MRNVKLINTQDGKVIEIPEEEFTHSMIPKNFVIADNLSVEEWIKLYQNALKPTEVKQEEFDYVVHYTVTGKMKFRAESEEEAAQMFETMDEESLMFHSEDVDGKILFITKSK